MCDWPKASMTKGGFRLGPFRITSNQSLSISPPPPARILKNSVPHFSQAYKVFVFLILNQEAKGSCFIFYLTKMKPWHKQYKDEENTWLKKQFIPIRPIILAIVHQLEVIKAVNALWH